MEESRALGVSLTAHLLDQSNDCFSLSLVESLVFFTRPHFEKKKKRKETVYKGILNP